MPIRRILRPFVTVLVILFTFTGTPVFAGSLFPNYIISDTELFTNHDLSRRGILDFFAKQGSGLATMRFDTPNGNRNAADIIYDAGDYWGISSRYLLTLLQKEQSLVTSAHPTEYQLNWATGFGVCDSCSVSDPSIQQYRGFYNQVNWGARRLRETYLPLIERTGKIYTFGPGISSTVDGVTVTPQNKATAMLFQYTPHIHGNQSFLNIWNRWFLRLFPDGTLLKQEGSDAYYLIDAGKKRPFGSLNVLLSSYDPKKAITVSPTELGAYETGATLAFPNFSLIRSPRGTIFLISDGAKRGIASKEVFRTIGFNPEEVQKASWVDIDAYPNGKVIDLTSAYPEGALLRVQNGGIVYVENGVRHAIYAKEIFQSRFKGRTATKVDETELANYPIGDPVLFRDGELIRTPTDRSIYVVSHGMKRPIASRDVFDRLGYRWKNIIVTSQRVLDSHPTGDPITIEGQ